MLKWFTAELLSKLHNVVFIIIIIIVIIIIIIIIIATVISVLLTFVIITVINEYVKFCKVGLLIPKDISSK